MHRIDDNRYFIADKLDVGSPHYIGEVRTDDAGRSWKFRVFVERSYIMEGLCDDPEDGIRLILRALWGHEME